MKKRIRVQPGKIHFARDVERLRARDPERNQFYSVNLCRAIGAQVTVKPEFVTCKVCSAMLERRGLDKVRRLSPAIIAGLAKLHAAGLEAGRKLAREVEAIRAEREATQ